MNATNDVVVGVSVFFVVGDPLLVLNVVLNESSRHMFRFLDLNMMFSWLLRCTNCANNWKRS